MLGLSFIFVSLMVLQMVYSQDAMPDKCRGPPPDVTNPKECCNIPYLFSEEDLASCGIQKGDCNVPHQHGPEECAKSLCILKKVNLIKDETKVDRDAASAFLDRYAAANPEFTDAVNTAKDKCFAPDLPGPPQVCEPDRAIFCTLHVLFENCPNWQDSDNCKKLKDHIEECKAYRRN